MHSRKAVPIIDLMNAANMELIRLDFKGIEKLIAG